MLVGRIPKDLSYAVGEYLGASEYEDEARSVIELIHWVYHARYWSGMQAEPSVLRMLEGRVTRVSAS